jgi:hypothetical protein
MHFGKVENRTAVRILLLAGIIATLAAVKLSYLPGTGPFGLDGSFYVNAARNVQEGVGLKTNTSMYHYGQTELPTRSRLIYPMWPLVAGYTARVVGLFPSINYLPPLFYVLDLLLLYVIANRLAAYLGVLLNIVTPGHLMVLLLGLNPNFWLVTAYPYTEGLGFLFAFLSILALDEGQRRWPVAMGVACALFASLALLTRSQLVIIGLALLVTVAWLVLSTRRFVFPMAFSATYLVCFAFWYFKVHHVTGSPGIELPAFSMWSEPQSSVEFLCQRWSGVAASLALLQPYSYFAAFGAAFTIPVVALPLAAAKWWRSRPRRLSIHPGSAMAVAAVFTALGTYAALNLFHHHDRFFIPWLFGYRHSLPMILVIALSFVFLQSFHRFTRVVALVCVGLSIAWGAAQIMDRVSSPRLQAPSAPESQLIAFLESHPKPPTIVTARAQHLSVYTRSNLHWTECGTSNEITRRMLAALPIDYVIVYAAESECAFIDGLHDWLKIEHSFGEGASEIYVLAPRSKSSGKAARKPAAAMGPRSAIVESVDLSAERLSPLTREGAELVPIVS